MRCRVGIATGMTIIGDAGGDGAPREPEIIGDPPHRAGRLQQSLQGDIVAIDPPTRHLIGDLFECRDGGTIEATGAAPPVHIWQVLERSAAANRFEALRPVGSRLSGPGLGMDQGRGCQGSQGGASAFFGADPGGGRRAVFARPPSASRRTK
jgi:hypothetical protein